MERPFEKGPQQMGEGHGWRETHFTRDYPQTTAYANEKMGVWHLTYGEVPGPTEFITANMLHRVIWMITQILTPEHSPKIDPH